MKKCKIIVIVKSTRTFMGIRRLVKTAVVYNFRSGCYLMENCAGGLSFRALGVLGKFHCLRSHLGV